MLEAHAFYVHLADSLFGVAECITAPARIRMVIKLSTTESMTGNATHGECMHVGKV